MEELRFPRKRKLSQLSEENREKRYKSFLDEMVKTREAFQEHLALKNELIRKQLEQLNRPYYPPPPFHHYPPPPHGYQPSTDPGAGYSVMYN